MSDPTTSDPEIISESQLESSKPEETQEAAPSKVEDAPPTATESDQAPDSEYPKLTLYYFNFEGRSAAHRMLLHVTGVPYTLADFPKSEWATKWKGKMPFGSVPVLEVEENGEKRLLWQSNAILQYIGKLAGMWNYDSFDESRALALLMSSEDLFAKLADINQQWLLKKVYKIMTFVGKDGGLNLFISRFAAQVQGKFFFGDQIGVPDIGVYALFKMLLGMPKVDVKVLPRIQENDVFLQWMKNVEADPKIFEYLKTNDKPTFER
eukprot:CAMPEP_0117447000 /NCGR_PEP_ID=MMETSP0759-20121206/6641_1 /TAXON_ID=63605 /ORGANISM="Percolomonas cosmopolitus, Strain WS" /LENGTH=264 /DNA_ID=CAMNT_0005239305 /DNA_START=26 /DNA_END=818 /DNA_ORIENTATION=-